MGRHLRHLPVAKRLDGADLGVDLNTNGILPGILVLLLAHCSVADPTLTGPSPGKAPARGASGFTLSDLKSGGVGSNRLFLSYNAGGASRWNPGWPARLDMTGVAWDSLRASTAVTPRHVVMAAHYARKLGDTLVFHDRTGQPHRRTLVKTQSLKSTPGRPDITVGLLDRPLPGTIKIYPLLKPAPDYADRLAGGPVLITNQERRLFVHEISYVSDTSLRFARNPDFHEDMRTSLIKGDSGHPAFLLVDGEPVLVETHSMGGDGAGPFYSAPGPFKALEQAIKRLDPRYRVRVVNLDPAYARRAAANREHREFYTRRNTDGSIKKIAKTPSAQATAPRPVARPTVRPKTPASSRQGVGQQPRPRRVPTTKTP